MQVNLLCSLGTHSFLLKEEEEKPVCIGCDENLTIEHILLDCWDFYDIRRKHYSAENLKVLFRDVPPDKIFDFLREINVFNKIWKWNMKRRDLLQIFEFLNDFECSNMKCDLLKYF